MGVFQIIEYPHTTPVMWGNMSCDEPQPYNKIGDGPEGPEVRLMGDGIRSVAKGYKLVQVDIRSGKYARTPPKGWDRLIEKLPLRVTEVGTHGKFSWIEFENGYSMWLSYGMSGSIKYVEDKHSHIEFRTDNPSREKFYYDDARNFGNVQCCQSPSLLKKKLDDMGYDLLADITMNDDEYLKRCRKYNHVNVCKFIMDQKVISGPGNYIKAEALYDCLINPYVSLRNLDDDDLLNLYRSMRNIALRSYRLRGATLYTYSGTSNEKGEFQDSLKVYSKAVDPLGNPVLSVSDTPDNRTTHFVPAIQRVGISQEVHLRNKIFKVAIRRA